MPGIRVFSLLAACLAAAGLATAQSSSPNSQNPSPQTIAQIANRLKAQEEESIELEEQIAGLTAGPQPPTLDTAADASLLDAMASVASPSQPLPPPEPAAPQAPAESSEPAGHNMELAHGPTLNIRGFFDFDFSDGSVANPLIFPIVDNGCGTCGNPATPAHTTFSAGEFDLFLSSKLSTNVSFLSEVVLGADTTNEFGVDIERYQLTYRANRYFSVSAGRVHTSIGYYNTAYHHGTWFSTATGRPIMYLFEDSGGILPIHLVGISLAGAVPGTDAAGLHWVAEIGNGAASNTGQVQNFYSDRDYKATNLAFYVRPDVLPGVQIGGSWYHDGLAPVTEPHLVLQNIGSAYVVYLAGPWEFLNEGVLLNNRISTTTQNFLSTMAYTQIAHKFGIYTPYFRYQYVNDHRNDPINLLKGTYYGPSAGVRIDVHEFAALKLQYNRLAESNQPTGNGFDAQVAFTF